MDNKQLEGEGVIKRGVGKAQELQGEAKTVIKKAIDAAQSSALRLAADFPLASLRH